MDPGGIMGKRSTKTDKNIYFQTRDDLSLTRAEAASRCETISEGRLEKIEYGLTEVEPADVIELARAYKKPELCNYYCTHECAIGKESVPEIKVSSLSEIVLKMLASLNDLESDKNRLIQITADGRITEDELKDFAKIEKGLESIQITVESLKLWVNHTIAQGQINETAFKEARQNNQ